MVSLGGEPSLLPPPLPRSPGEPSARQPLKSAHFKGPLSNIKGSPGVGGGHAASNLRIKARYRQRGERAEGRRGGGGDGGGGAKLTAGKKRERIETCAGEAAMVVRMEGEKKGVQDWEI